MSEMVKIRIKLLVGSNGKVSACVDADMGWGDLADNIMDYADRRHLDPEASSRHYIDVEVPLPTVMVLPAALSQAPPKGTEQ